MPAKKKSLAYKALIWSVRALLVLLAAFAVNLAYHRLRGPSEAQRAALALMRKDYRPEHGVNAFPLLFYLRYDVPVDRLEARMVIEVEKVRQWLETNPPASASYRIDAPLLPELSEEETAMLCETTGAGCLAQVAAHGDAVRAVLTAHPVIVERAQAFERTDFNWNEFPDSHLAPREYGSEGPRLWLSAFALQYAEGDRTGALAATCRNLAAWRRLARGSNAMVSTMLASARMDGAIRLYADMLAGLPADADVPEDCTLALQPVVAADVDRCAMWASDFALLESMYRKVADEDKPLLISAMFNREQTVAWAAQRLAAPCGGDAAAHFLADELPPREKLGRFLGILPLPPGTNGWECLSNFHGCVFAGIATPDYEQFDAGALDHAAHLRLAATLLWLREHPEGSVAERFERRPAELRSPNHTSGFDAGRGVLSIENMRQAPCCGKQQFELPVDARQ